MSITSKQSPAPGCGFYYTITRSHEFSLMLSHYQKPLSMLFKGCSFQPIDLSKVVVIVMHEILEFKNPSYHGHGVTIYCAILMLFLPISYCDYRKYIELEFEPTIAIDGTGNFLVLNIYKDAYYE